MPLAELFLNKKWSNLSFLPVFPNQNSVVLHCLECMLVQFPFLSRDRLELPILARVLELDTVAHVLRT